MRRLSFAVCLAMIAVPAAAQFPDIGGLLKGAQSLKKAGDATRTIAEPEEIKLGDDLTSVLLGAAPLVANPPLQRYVNRVGMWLATQTERPGLPWRFGVIDSADVNAFSTPGGTVLITRGLYDRLRNESELAGVLAHEIAHVLRRHQLKALQKSLGSAAFSDMASVYASAAGSPSLASATRFVNGGKELLIRGLDKDDEFEADRMGVVIAARSGYSPYGLVAVLQTLSTAPADAAFALLFKTHPSPTARLERLSGAMGEKLDGIPNLVDNTSGFIALRNPPAAKATPAPRPTGRKRR